MDREVSRPRRIHPSLRSLSSLPGADLFRDHQLDPAHPILLAGLRVDHPLHDGTGDLVDLQTGLAGSRAPGADSCAPAHHISRVQSALGGVYTYQSGIDPVSFL